MPRVSSKSAKRDAHQRDDEREPAGVGAGAGRAESAEKRLKQNCGQHARAHHGRTPLQELTRAVVGGGDALWRCGSAFDHGHAAHDPCARRSIT